jgi:hypothetical protein
MDGFAIANDTEATFSRITRANALRRWSLAWRSAKEGGPAWVLTPGLDQDGWMDFITNLDHEFYSLYPEQTVKPSTTRRYRQIGKASEMMSGWGRSFRLRQRRQS